MHYNQIYYAEVPCFSTRKTEYFAKNTINTHYYTRAYCTNEVDISKIAFTCARICCLFVDTRTITMELLFLYILT